MTKRRARQAARDSGEPEQFGGPPTVISVEAGLGYGSMLVDRSPGVGGANPVQVEELGLEEGQELGRQRSALAYAVQRELGPDVEVLLDGQPVHGRHGP